MRGQIFNCWTSMWISTHSTRCGFPLKRVQSWACNVLNRIMKRLKCRAVSSGMGFDPQVGHVGNGQKTMLTLRGHVQNFVYKFRCGPSHCSLFSIFQLLRMEIEEICKQLTWIFLLLNNNLHVPISEMFTYGDVAHKTL